METISAQRRPAFTVEQIPHDETVRHTEDSEIEDSEDSAESSTDATAISWHESIPPTPRSLTTPDGLKFLIMTAVLSAIALGTVWHLGGLFFDLIFLTPLAAGFALAFAIDKAVSKTHWRRQVTLVWLGVFAAVLILTTRYVEDGMAARPLVIQSLTKYIAARDHLPTDVVTERLEQIITPFDAFKIYMLATADRGTTIGRDMGMTYLMSSGTRVSGIPFRGYGFWVLLVLQSAAMVCVCAVATGTTVHLGYCNECGKWAKRHWLFRKQGHQAEALADHVRSQNWAQADEMRLGGKLNTKDYSSAHVLHCAHCVSQTLIVNRITRGEEKHLLYARLSDESSEALRTAVRQIA